MSKTSKPERESISPELIETVEAFLAHMALERGAAKLTVEAYESDLAKFASHCTKAGRTHWKDVTLSDVDAWTAALNHQGHVAASLARRLSAVRSFAAYLVRSAIRRDDFTELAHGPKFRRKLPGTISITETAKVVTAPDTSTPQGLRDRAMLELMYGSGLRNSELCALEIQAVDFDSALVRVTGKGSKDRIVPVGETALVALQAYLQAGRPKLMRSRTGSALFLSARGVAISRKTFWLSVKQAAERSGIDSPVKPHLLRHAFATHLLAGGADLRSIQEMLGHADIATTQIYTSVNRAELADSHRRHHPRGRGKNR